MRRHAGQHGDYVLRTVFGDPQDHEEQKVIHGRSAQRQAKQREAHKKKKTRFTNVELSTRRTEPMQA